jgi:zinc finger SWIM domain-containing protein 3
MGCLAGEDKGDTHKNIIRGMTFVSEEQAFEFYNKYAKQQGFSIRRERVMWLTTKTGTQILRYRRFRCSRAGKREDKWFNLEDRQCRARPLSRCSCKAHFSVSYKRKRGHWVVLRFEDTHNHVLAGPDEVPFLRSHRKINPYQRVEIMSLAADGMRKFHIFRVLMSRCGKFGLLGFIRKDLYNMSYRKKRKLIGKGDANTAIGIMEKRQKDDPNFFSITSLIRKVGWNTCCGVILSPVRTIWTLVTCWCLTVHTK